MAVRNKTGILQLNGKEERENQKMIDGQVSVLKNYISTIQGMKEDIVDFIETYNFIKEQDNQDTRKWLANFDYKWGTSSTWVNVCGEEIRISKMRSDNNIRTDGENVYLVCHTEDEDGVNVYSYENLNDYINVPGVFKCTKKNVTMDLVYYFDKETKVGFKYSGCVNVYDLTQDLRVFVEVLQAKMKDFFEQVENL